MARGTVDEIQDKLLSGFSKISDKAGHRESEDDRWDKINSLSGSAKRKAIPFGDYERNLMEYIAAKENKLERTISKELSNRKNKEKVQAFHTEGAEYVTAYLWIKEQRD